MTGGALGVVGQRGGWWAAGHLFLFLLFLIAGHEIGYFGRYHAAVFL